MKKKNYIVLTIFLCVCSILALGFGVYAATSASFSASANLVFDLNDCSVKMFASISGTSKEISPYSASSTGNGSTPSWELGELYFDRQKSEIEITIKVENYSTFEVDVHIGGFNEGITGSLLSRTTNNNFILAAYDGNTAAFDTLKLNFILLEGATSFNLANNMKLEISNITNWNNVAETTWYTNNVSANVYNLSTSAQFAGFANLVTNGTDFAGKTVNLTKNIYMNDYKKFTFDANGLVTVASGAYETPSIGKYNASNAFRGTFNGNFYSIIGIYETLASNGANALFENAENSVIKNFDISKFSYIKGNTVTAIIAKITNSTLFNINTYTTISSTAVGSSTAGIILFATNSEIINCRSLNKINYNTSNSTNFYGGIVYNAVSSNLYYCENFVSVNHNNQYMRIGGIVNSLNVGSSNIKVVGCKNFGDINSSASSSAYTAGIIGEATGSGTLLIEDCTNYGSISGNIGSQISGLVGTCSITNTTISRCGNEGNITGASGIITGVLKVMNECYNTGNIVNYYSGVPTYTSGLACVTASLSNLTVSNCYNLGEIFSPNATLGGLASGIISFNTSPTNATIKNCYNIGRIYCSITNNYGAISSLFSTIGSGNTAINNYYNPQTSQVPTFDANTTYDISKNFTRSTDQMKAGSFVIELGPSYKFNTNGYPKFIWQK